MDPFKEVEEDCWSQIHSLGTFVKRSFHITDEAKLDFHNNYEELTETLEDLKQAVQISESNPSQFNLSSSEIVNRKQILSQLQLKIAGLKNEWDERVKYPQRQREITTMSNRISQDEDREGPSSDSRRIDREFNQFQEQEAIQNQDLQLDSIHETMRNLNQQAQMMGGELEEQGFMLDELDQDMDTVGSKLQRGLKRVNYVIEKNRDTASNCCIGVLVVVLVILLVLLIVA